VRQVLGWSCGCVVGLPGAADVPHNRERSPKQGQKGNDRDDEENAHTCLLRIPKQAVRNCAGVNAAQLLSTSLVPPCYFMLIAHTVLSDT